MSVGAILVLVILVLCVVAFAYQLAFNDRSGSLDDSASGPIAHRDRRGPGSGSDQRRDHDW